MTESLSVLQRATAADLRHQPFPHLVIQNALPDELSRALLESFPSPASLGVDQDADNQRWSYPAARVADNPALALPWRKLIAYHASTAFFHEFATLFRQPLERLYGRRLGDTPLHELTTGVRNSEAALSPSTADSGNRPNILLDAQICGNTPVRQASSVRTVHVDKSNKLFVGLYYLRHDADDSDGGDLQLYRFRPGHGVNDGRCYRGVYLQPHCVEPVRAVPYAHNTLVMFINSPGALHGVSVRQPTRHSRLFMNLLGEADRPLFELPKPPLLARLRRRIKAPKNDRSAL